MGGIQGRPKFESKPTLPTNGFGRRTSFFIASLWPITSLWPESCCGKTLFSIRENVVDAPTRLLGSYSL